MTEQALAGGAARGHGIGTPADGERLWWIRDQMHFPRPMCPYTISVEVPAMSSGASKGFRSYGIPASFLLANFDGYNYNAVEFDSTDVAAWLPAVQTAVIGRLNGLLDEWHGTMLPEVMRHNRRLRDFDYAGASTDELIAQIDESRRIRERLWDLHMQVVIPVLFAANELANVWGVAFGEDRRDESALLFTGHANKTVEAGVALWKLSRDARALPGVAELIAVTPLKRIVPLLGTTDAGRAFKAKLDAYLDEYGWRTGAFEYADPPQIDDPTIPLATLRDFLAEPDDRDPGLRTAQAARERDALLDRLGPEIDAHPAGPMLRMLIAACQQYVPVQEDHNFYIDQMGTVLMRLPPLEAGRRLAAADAIALAEDVFYLAVDEVKGALRAPASRGWAELVAERRDILQEQAHRRPPDTIGTPWPQELQDDPALGGFNRFFGDVVEQDEHSNVLRGTAASRGVVSGPACVVSTLDQTDRLRPGDILVCEMTMPAWTPLFAVAAGVVTDSGGMLSHSAIVAREYGIPCVCGASGATRRIRDGQRVTVDGAAGTVTLHQD